MRTLFFSTFILLALSSCQAQTPKESSPKTQKTKQLVGGGCDGCELMFLGMPATINAVDTSAGWHEEGTKILITGTVYKIDGKTPASNVIIYYWQTDSKGYYSPTPTMHSEAQRHGHLRGWVKTDLSGSYAIYTIKPAPYPNSDIPAHIHTSIKEQNIDNEYYIDEFVFDDDRLLTSKKRKALENRGGSGILRLVNANGLWTAEHNIILGLNIPDYPEKIKENTTSGLKIGEDSPSFIPFHAWGTDKGTQTCPVCKYGRYHGLMYFVGNQPQWSEIKKWLAFLDNESIKRQKYLKVYFVYGNEKNYSKVERQKELEKIGKELDFQKVALTFVPSFQDKESEVNLNKINPSVENTFVIYRNRSIIDKFVDLKATESNFKMIASILDKTKSKYFDFPEPKHD